MGYLVEANISDETQILNGGSDFRRYLELIGDRVRKRSGEGGFSLGMYSIQNLSTDGEEYGRG